jgi:hypothetical protein
MKQNMLSIIFGETKANKSRPAPKSVQFLPGPPHAVDQQIIFGMLMILHILQEVLAALGANPSARIKVLESIQDGM